MTSLLYSRLFSDADELILTGCSADVNIIDVHAFVDMSQNFENPFEHTVFATYSIAIASGAAVCGFEMHRSNGIVVQGICMEREQAVSAFDQAVKLGYTASLGEEHAKDVFSIRVGNIMPAEVITVHLRFFQPLLDDESKDQIRFVFPRAYFPRYGEAPSSQAATMSATLQPFSLTAVVQQAAPIRGISCSSGHFMSFLQGPPGGTSPDDPSHFATVTVQDKLGSSTADVLLVLTVTNLDSPRSFIEEHPSPNHPTTAIGMTFVPRFNLTDCQDGMEYIFLLDRSGSMEGSKIQLLREALVVLLRGLPTKNTSFNIVSFGTKTTKLWPRSETYTQASLDSATRHIDSIEANYGGTEISDALQTVFSSLSKPLERPVSILLLTDGGAWDISTCVAHTESALSELPKSNTFIRVFTVGIGSGVSTDTCESIARAGGGMALYVSEGEPLTGKCARLVRASRTPPVVDMEVLWPGNSHEKEEDSDFEVVDAAEPAVVDLYQQGEDDADAVGPPPEVAVVLPPPSPVQQAPVKIPSIFPGTRTALFAILSKSVFQTGSTFPASIKVRGKVQTTGHRVELDVPVVKFLNTTTAAVPVLHTLAAKTLITDLEDGRNVPLALSSFIATDPHLKDAYLRQEIVRLGTTYSLSSQATSFVAIDQTPQDISPHAKMLNAQAHGGTWPTTALPRGSRFRKGFRGGRGGQYSGSSSSGYAPAAVPYSPTAGHYSPTGASMPAASARYSPTSPSFSPSSARYSPGSTSQSGFLDVEAEVSDYELDENESENEHEEDTSSQQNIRRKRVSYAVIDEEEEEHERKRIRRDDDPVANLTAIARLQQFDGRFDLSQALLNVLNVVPRMDNIQAAILNIGMTDLSDVDGLVATLLVWLWFKQQTREEVFDLSEKSREWLMATTGWDLATLEKVGVEVSALVT